jgi:iron(III) transport system substrate-binding protein
MPGSRIINRWIAGAAVLAACGALAACGSGSSGSAGDPSAPLTLYSGQHVQTAQNLITAFTKQSGIKINLRSDDEDPLADQIATEGANSPADLFYTENTPPLESLQAKGLLSPVDPSTLSKAPARYSSAKGDWVAISGRTSVIVYNPSLISASQLPTRITAFADPKYRGKLAIAPQETDFQPIVTAYDRAYGQAATLQWLRALKANASGGHIYPDNETIVSEVNQGSIAFGLINQYYYYRMQAEIGASKVHAKITHLAPRDPGYVIDVSGAAVLKSSKHQAEAQKFLAFLVSKQGQEIIGTPGTGPNESISFEYPLDSGVTTKASETPFSQLQPNAISVSDLGTGATAISLMRQAGLL